MSDGPGEEVLWSAVDQATRAPSVHNTQPWRWRWEPGAVWLYADWGRQLPVADPRGWDVLMSCGAALHHLRVALAAAGWATEVRRLPDPTDGSLLAAVRTHPHQPTEEERRTASTIPERRSDRRRYDLWQVPTALIREMEERAAEQGVTVRPVTDPATRYRLVSAMREAAERQESDEAYLSELAAWSGRLSHDVEGVPAANTLAPGAEDPDVPTRWFPGGELPRSPRQLNDPDAGTLLVLGSAREDRMSWLRAGEALSAVLLCAAEHGLVSCPLSQALEVPLTRDALRERVLDAETYPHIVVRVGCPLLNAPPLAETPRRPLAEIVERAAPVR
ncbi:NAD(P)H nitroreductase [Actinoalloteichus sp. AHMU CJ021]|uniref:Acg family FMN-binding oxidoreductase n=1 Tax=Actinoalloteichus sp. AHMU CJ021 TaxID=2072503 RepID=UPI000CA0863F|nr:NAD(P)H nitroreductase [Actinoalloteichus sp. AHMU CJ021]